MCCREQRSRLHQELRQHDVRDRQSVQAGSRCSSAPSRSSSFSTPITSRTARRARCGASARRRSIRSPAISAGDRGALRPAPRGRERGGAARCSTRSATRRHVPAFIEQVKAGNGRLMGFGHRVYKSYDPRAKLIKQVADDVFEQTGSDSAARDRARTRADRARGRVLRLAPGSPRTSTSTRAHLPGDGLPGDYFTVLFALGRLPGWIAQWGAPGADPERKISRPRQVYVGQDQALVPCRSRSAARWSRSWARAAAARRRCSTASPASTRSTTARS